MDIEEFLDSFEWDEGKILETHFGTKLLITAPYFDSKARGMFFKYWRKYKDRIKGVNASCAPDNNNKYNSIKLWLKYSDDNDKNEIRKNGIAAFNDMFREIYDEENDEGSWEDI